MNFELRTHGSNTEEPLFQLQPYTDYLFRSLQQLSPEKEGGWGFKNIIASDLRTLQRAVLSAPLRGDPNDPKTEAGRAKLWMREYFADPNVCKLWRRLLLSESTHGGQREPSPLYAGLIVAAEALLVIAHGRPQEAHKLIRDYFYVKEADTSTEEDDEDEEETSDVENGETH